MSGTYYFTGIGGIGMSALAQMLADQGASVSGSDREIGKITELLEDRGIPVRIRQRGENVPEDATVLVYSDAVPEDNVERLRAKELGIPEKSYFEMLGEVSKSLTTIAVAGTHGKTTTTSMLAKILKDAGASPTAIIGSIVKDFGSNYLHGDSELFVVEACEYRDHLLQLSPHILVINNLEWDHTDWFPSIEAMQETFRKAAESVPEGGAIVTNTSDPLIAAILKNVKARIVDYLSEPAYPLSLEGHFNLQNARAAAAAARLASTLVTNKSTGESLATFQGTWRRFEYRGVSAQGAKVFDDYAHHPTAIRETLTALRAKAVGQVYVAFHPHLYSRTRDLLDEFATAFKDADHVLIAPIYAAREKDDGSISSEMLAERVRANGVDARALDSFEAIEEALNQAGEGDVVMTMGAGDIYKVADKVAVKAYSS